MLPYHIDLMLGQYIANLGKHTRLVVVNMHQPMRVFQQRKLHIREINAVKRASRIYVFNDLVRHKVSDVLLGLLRAAAEYGAKESYWATPRSSDLNSS